MKTPLCVSCGQPALRLSSPGLDRWDINRMLKLDGWFRFASLQYRVCAACGYVQAFVHRAPDRAYIAEHWQEDGKDPSLSPTRSFTLTPPMVGVAAAVLAMGIALVAALKH